ncbi:MAG: HNH endonuclease [Clostridia bacterium]|nr:HNH endonuclease [Clostridia bacterium]
MQDNFYGRFTKIIRECNYDNTYKMAWAKSLVEICSNQEFLGEKLTISLKEIAHKFLKYYWNQTIFFDLIQGSNPNRPPIILTLIKSLIEKYYIAINKKQPEVFEKVEDRFANIGMQNDFEKTLIDIAKILKNDVSWRFDNIDDNSTKLYDYQQKLDFLVIDKDNAIVLKNHQQDLYDLINYRWSLILESFNSSPRINKKVRIIDERCIKRSPLNKFKTYLDVENPNHFCFICGKQTSSRELAIDHVIPWSYMYSDDLWNLVYICQHCNSIKSNVIPSKGQIDRLKERNKKLLLLLEQQSSHTKMIEELKLAIEKDYVNKFWTGCKG